MTPTDYKYLNRVPTLKGIAIVDPEHTAHANAEIEATFSKKPFKIFTSLLEAANWAEDLH